MKDMKHDRDASVDRLLAGTLEARTGGPDDRCLDTETVAAWADGALDARERSAAEAHAADCARCQALLAAMVRTLPPPDLVKPWWRMPALGWLVPVTAATTALVIWVAVPKQAPPRPADTIATAVDRVAPASPSASSDEAQAKVPAQAVPRAAAAATPESKNETLPGRAAAAPPPLAPAGENRLADALEKQASPSPLPPPSPRPLSESVTIAPAVPVDPAAVAQEGRSAAAPLSATKAREARQLSGVSAFSNAAEAVVVSSNPATRFRLLPGGDVQRSADGGGTWRTEVTGVTEALTAGASPSPSVCWLVGPSGTVLLSTDGRSWRRLAFPETVDLRAVTATDSEAATVTTVDGRAFVTADGGRSWSRTPGL